MSFRNTNSVDADRRLGACTALGVFGQALATFKKALRSIQVRRLTTTSDLPTRAWGATPMRWTPSTHSC